MLRTIASLRGISGYFSARLYDAAYHRSIVPKDIFQTDFPGSKISCSLPLPT